MQKTLWALFKMGLAVGVTWVLAHAYAHNVNHLIESNASAHVLGFLLPIAVYIGISLLSNYVSIQRPIPSFVVALFLGQACKPLLGGIAENEHLLEGIVTLMAATILFQGGLETPLKNFKRLFWKISALATIGVWVSAITLAYAAYLMGGWTGAGLTFTVVVLLGGVLASTDPAAVIPLFQTMKFRDEEPKDIAVSESAMNDVVGALLVTTFLGVLATLPTGFNSINDGFIGKLFTASSGVFLLKQVVIGGLVGLGGWGLLQLFVFGYRRKELTQGTRGLSLLVVPIISYFVATLFGGSGFLAAFIAGLLFHVSHEREPDVVHYGENFIDGFSKPIVFASLGAMADLNSLGKYAGIGLLTAAVFIFILRPLMVYLMLGGFALGGRMRWRQLAFLAWIRETGAIPAVLLVTVASKNIAGTEALVPIGMWVILMTLIIQPPLTPIWAKRLAIAES